MGRYIFSKETENDLQGIYRYGFLEHGEEQAERYSASLKEKCQLLADTPYLYRERHEFTPPVRIHHHKKHLIIYLVEAEHIFIARILHERMDVQSHLDE
jgi:toxin ParE1/3/4